MNTGIAGARDPLAMAEAMNLAVRAGRLAYLAGRIPKKLYATRIQPSRRNDRVTRPRSRFQSLPDYRQETAPRGRELPVCCRRGPPRGG